MPGDLFLARAMMPRRFQAEAGLRPLPVGLGVAIFGKTEIALHALNDGGQGVASLLSVGFAESSALNVPIRLGLRFRRLALNDNATKGSKSGKHPA